MLRIQLIAQIDVKGNSIKFHGFPQNDKQLLKKWIIAIKRDNLTPLKGTKRCSEHYLPSDYYPSLFKRAPKN